MALIDRLDLGSWVVRTGWVAHDILPAFYAMAEALILPSLYESFGMPLLEAMSSGCPIVTANRYGPRELVGNAGVLVDPDQVDSIADGMDQVVVDQALRRWLVQSGYERVQRFSWKTCAQETLQALESAITWPRQVRQRPWSGTQPAGAQQGPSEVQQASQHT